MTKNQKALTWGCLPGTIVVLNLVLYPLTSFLFQRGSGSEAVQVFAMIVRTIQGFLGIVAMIMVPIGIVMAIVIATNKDDEPKTPLPPVKNA